MSFRKLVDYSSFFLLILAVLYPNGVLGYEKKRVIILETMTAPIVQEFTASFLEEFEKLVAGSDDYHITVLNGQGKIEFAEKLLKHELVNKPDLIVTVATMASKVAKKYAEKNNIPQIFMCVTDPVGAGLVEKVGVSQQSNITGKVHYIPASIRVEIINRVLETAKVEKKVRFGFIHTDYPSDLSDLHRIREELEKRQGFELVPYEISYRPLPESIDFLLSELNTAIKKLDDKVDYYWAPRGALAILPEHDETILTQAEKPFLVGATEQSVQRGALMQITADPVSQGAETAAISFQVLNGHNIKDIPVSLPSKIEFAVNLRTAKEHGLVIPSDLLQLAGEHVYR